MIEQLSRIRIVLVETSHPGNIGAAARAMKTMGLQRLVLVRPQHYPSAEATARASGADDVLAQVRVCDSLEEAVADCILVVGSTARERRLEWGELSPAAAAETLCRQTLQGEVALVFGRERTGLSNEELACCQQRVTIDANPQYSSLNLAAAVQVLCYELRQYALANTVTVGNLNGTASDTAVEQPATSAQLEGLFQHFEQALTDMRVVQSGQSKTTLMLRLRRLFFRTQLTSTEINILRGILSAAQGRKQPHYRDGSHSSILD